MMRGSRALLLSLVLLLAACGGGGGGGGDATPTGPFTISGTITPAAGSTVDSDVNDPSSTVLDNDSPATSQQIRNPSTVGGYVNRTTDPSDFYRVSLLASQQVVLTVADFDSVPPDPDLDLFLYLDDGSIDPDNPDFASMGTHAQEELTVPNDGDYVIEVFANSGASNYNLRIVQSAPLSTGLNPLRMDHDFVPGELIVKLKSEVIGPLGDGGAWARALGLGHKFGRPDEPMLMSLGGEVSTANLSRGLNPNQHREGRLDRMYRSDKARHAKFRTLQAIKALRKRADILYAEPNFIRTISRIPNDPRYASQWHYPLINLPEAWDNAFSNPDVVVAVIDSGVLLAHPDLSGQLVSGYDFISDPARALDGDGRDPNPDDPGDLLYGASSSFHGTHVAGTVAAASGNEIGVAGVTWQTQTKVMPLRALGFEGGTDLDIAHAILFAAGLRDEPGVARPRPADVVNLSLGKTGSSNTLCSAVAQAYEAGTIVVAAAGNRASSEFVFPASCPGAVSVSAVSRNKTLASYSSFGSEIDVAAPGGDRLVDEGVFSTWGFDGSGSIELGYGASQGTSMAAPHVAGVIALMEAASATDLTPEMFDSLLAGGQLTEDLGAVGKDTLYGYGLINALKSVSAAQGATLDDPLLTVAPSSVNLGTSGTGVEISLSNIGGGAPEVTSVTVQPASAAVWLSVGASNVDSEGLGSYTANVNRTPVSDGTYAANIVFSTTAGSVQTAVLMQKLSGVFADDAGMQYVLVVDWSSGQPEPVAQIQVEVNAGLYSYTLFDVPSGDYQIYTGSDLDNDLTICDAGEACGAYLTLDEPVTLTVDSDLSGVDFGTGFQVSIPSAASLGTTADPRVPLIRGTPEN